MFVARRRGACFRDEMPATLGAIGTKIMSIASE
jgi:hypothetical protein